MNEPRTNVQEMLLDPNTKHPFRLRRLGLGGVTLALFVGACTADPVVYPNRNPPASSGGSTEVGEGGEAGAEVGELGGNGGGGRGGKGGTGGGGGTVSKGGSGGSLTGNGGTSGAPMTGPVCGDGKIEPPEDCEDGNTESGDGCSADCQSACEICEQNVCPTFDFPDEHTTPSAYDDCYKLSGIIMTGPAMGVTRAEVCRELVDCIREEGCAQTKGPLFDTKRCWCDKDWVGPELPDRNRVTECQTEPDPKTPNDPTKFIPGKCASLFQDASESPKLQDVLSVLFATDLAEGAANRLLSKCDTRVCTEECLPSYFKSINPITITADIFSARNAAGESALGDLIADSQRAIANVDFALVAASEADPSDGIPGLVFAATPGRAADKDGTVLRSEIFGAMLGYSGYDTTGSAFAPYDSNLYKASLTGDKIYAALEQQFGSTSVPQSNKALYVSGLTYTWDAEKQPPAARIVEVRKDGVLLDKAASYMVVLGTRLVASTGPIAALAGVSATVLPDVEPVQLLGEYMSQLPQPVAPPAINRITRLH